LEFGNGGILTKSSVVNPRFGRAAEVNWGFLFMGVNQMIYEKHEDMK
jgi:hypothetical protein